MKKRISYFSYEGILEPLGNSQVLNYLIILSKNYEITLFSFEKKCDLQNIKRYEYISKLCESNSIIWMKATYSNNSLLKNFNPVKYFFFILANLSKVRSTIHARSFLPALISFFLKFLNHEYNYIYDMRGYWIEEKVDVGKVSNKSFTYKVLTFFDKKILYNSAHIITLSNVSKKFISNNYSIDSNKITTIYTCTDLNKFKLISKKVQNNKICFGYVGTTVGWYMFDETLNFIKIALDKIPNSYFKIITRDNKNAILDKIVKFGINLEKVKIVASDFEYIQKEFEEITFSVFFIRQSFSKTASMPTKFGELLASGIPCIVNSKIGDMDEILLKNSHCGYIINNHSSYDYLFVIDQIINDFNNIDSESCRHVSEKHFSLENGAKIYTSIYEKICD